MPQPARNAKKVEARHRRGHQRRPSRPAAVNIRLRIKWPRKEKEPLESKTPRSSDPGALQ